MNPFEELDLDPRLGPDALTETLRRRAEKAEGATRQRIQELWRVLTLNERDRVRWAFFAHPRDQDGRSIEALRERVPPVIVRRKAPPLAPRGEDVVVFEQRELDAPAVLRPRAIFDDDLEP